MKTFTVTQDIGFEPSMKYQGTVPTNDDFDTLYDATKIGEDFIIYGPADVFGDRPICAAVKRRAFTGPVYDEIRTFLNGVNMTSDLRIAQAGPWDPQELKEKYGWIEGKDYMFKGDNKNAMIRRKKDGSWDTVARGRSIHSVLMGYKRGRFTGEIDLDAYCKKNPEALVPLNKMNVIAELAYGELAPNEFKAQKSWADRNIKKDYHLGGTIFTTLSVNKYQANDTSMMGYHIDAGDLNSSLTCLSVFHVGKFTGAYFVLPRYRVAVAVGDGDVFVGDSRQQHGVSTLKGKGTRLSVVSYCDTRLADEAQLRTTEY